MNRTSASKQNYFGVSCFVSAVVQSCCTVWNEDTKAGSSKQVNGIYSLYKTEFDGAATTENAMENRSKHIKHRNENNANKDKNLTKAAW